ncbi:energy transducer TonB [Flavobacteriales bacterium]|nr:energy transducer TonB [Flavobacteriales bacterium]
MEVKKNPQVNLESKKGLFLQIGLVVSLLLVLGAFEYKSYEQSAYNLGQLNLDDLEEEIIPITKQEVKPPPPPPPPPEVIEIVEDEVEIENEIEIEDTESDEDEVIEIEEEDDEEFFMVVENMPEFPGGDLGLMQYIQKNVRYPPIAKEYNITGKVYVSFIVDRQGKVTNVKIVRGVDKNLDAEAVRVVKSLPKYKPGKQRGKPVRVMFTIPINFTLN